MKKIAISVSALFLALGVLSGCGEKKEEAPKAEVPAQEGMAGMSGMEGQAPAQEGMAGMSGMEGQAPAQEGMAGMSGMEGQAPAQEGMSGMAAEQAAQAAGDAAQAAGDAAQAAGAAVADAAGDAAQAAGDAAQAAGDAVKDAAGGAMQAAGDAAQAVADTAQQAAGGAVDGEKVYRGLCFSCHDMGVANAPKLGDKEAWAPRIAAGTDVMYDTALHGNPAKPAMPAKGGNPALSDDEVKAAVDWMVSQAQ